LLCAWAGASAAETVLHRGNGTEPETLDVHKSSGVSEAHIQRDLFEGLVTEAADGSLLPGVAESWQISPDGTPVTAEDFVFAYRRALDPTTGSDYAFILWPIRDAEAASKGTAGALENLGIDALDAHTLRLTLSAPTPYFLQLLTHHMAYPVPRRAIEAHGRRWTRPGNMVSNGAYRLVDWVPQSHIRLEFNPYHRDAPKLPISAVVYYPTEDANTELKRFRAGELHVTSTVPATQLRWVRKNLADAFRQTPYLGTYYYALNLTGAPFKDNAKFRQALMLAIDRELITDKVLQGGEVPAYGWVPPGVLNYARAAIAEEGWDQARRDARARELMRESGLGDTPPTLELLYNTSADHKRIAVAVASMWSRVLGVKVALRNEEWKVYLDSRARMDFQVARSGWIGDYNDANTFLELFKSDVGRMNPSAYVSAQYDTLVREAETTTDAGKRADLLRRAEARLLTDVALIPIYFYTTKHLVAPRVRGWVDNVINTHPTQYLSLAN
jgi:oligopeptide transport system substrate-binding protein